MPGLCDDFFDVSPWLGYHAPLFIILCKYRVYTINFDYTYVRWFDTCYEKIIELGEALDTQGGTFSTEPSV